MNNQELETPRKTNWFLIILLVLLIAIIAGGVYYYYNKDQINLSGFSQQPATDEVQDADTVTTEQTPDTTPKTDLSSDISAIEKEINSVSSEDFGGDSLSDSELGL